LELYATPSEGVDVLTVEKALKDEVAKIVEFGVTDEELNRIKTGVIASDVYQKDSVFYQGMQIGQLETMGYPHQLMDQYTNKIKAVNSKQVQAVAKKYLIDEKLTVVTLDPQPLDRNHKPQGRPHAH